MPATDSAEAAPGRPAPAPYDFRRPTKLAREHGRLLEMVYETVARQWATVLGSELGTTCQVTFGALYDYYGANFTSQRWALLSYTRDWIVPIYFGFDIEQFPQAIEEIVQTRVDPHAQARYFLLDEVGHVLLTAPMPVVSAGVDLQAWLAQMVDDDPAWASVHP